MTYFNPRATQATNVPWADNFGNTGKVLAKSFHSQPYYPGFNLFPAIDTTAHTYAGTRIEGKIDTSNPAFIASVRRAFGYADNRPRGSAPFTMPGNPYISTIENAGGDGFDINWAVDAGGNYIDLDEIHFIKVHTAMQGDAGWLGEISTEITGAIVVGPSSIITGVTEVVVIKDIPAVITELPLQLEALAFKRGRVQRDKKIRWSTTLEGSFVDEQMVLHASTPGQITLTATLADNPAISATVSSLVDHSSSHVSISANDRKISVYPNPASEFISLAGVENASVFIYSTEGRLMLSHENFRKGERIGIAELPHGVYFVKVVDGFHIHTLSFIRKK